MEFYNNTKSANTESTNQLRQARGGNLYNRVSSDEAMELIQRLNAPIIGFIEQKVEGKLPKVICCEVAGARSHWLFALAKNAENCQTGVPYIFTVEAVRYNRDDTPYIMVRPVTLLSADLMQNGRFGDLLVKSGRFPMYWPLDKSSEWNYEPLRKHFNLPDNAIEREVCKHAVDQALAGNISFEEIVDLIHLPARFAVSLGGAEAVKPGTLRYQEPAGKKPKRKRTCKGKKYKEPRQKPAATASTNTGKSGKNKDGGKKKKGN